MTPHRNTDVAVTGEPDTHPSARALRSAFSSTRPCWRQSVAHTETHPGSAGRWLRSVSAPPIVVITSGTFIFSLGAAQSRDVTCSPAQALRSRLLPAPCPVRKSPIGLSRTLSRTKQYCLYLYYFRPNFPASCLGVAWPDGRGCEAQGEWRAGGPALMAWSRPLPRERTAPPRTAR